MVLNRPFLAGAWILCRGYSHTGVPKIKSWQAHLLLSVKCGCIYSRRAQCYLLWDADVICILKYCMLLMETQLLTDCSEEQCPAGIFFCGIQVKENGLAMPQVEMAYFEAHLCGSSFRICLVKEERCGSEEGECQKTVWLLNFSPVNLASLYFNSMYAKLLLHKYIFFKKSKMVACPAL